MGAPWKSLLGIAAATCLAGLAAASCGDDAGSVFDAGNNDGGTINPNDDGGILPTGDGGGPTKCVPKTCLELGYTCGPNGDGCGNLLDCGQCTAPEICGGAGYSKCGGNTGIGPDGAPICNPKTCQQLGFTCGPAGDGCGGLLQCGTCTMPDICGGGGKPSVCGNNIPCLNLCKQQVSCDGGPLTTITGTVVAGTLPMYGNPDPVPNVLVYVPNAAVQPFAPGVQCSQCGADVSGDPLVQTTTAVNGTFTLTNVPVGNNIPVVIQLGRWRRQVTFNVPACQSTNVGQIRMPRNKSEGDIPFTAISTGDVDAMECVLLKMGVDAAEFTRPTLGGRMEMYVGNGANRGNGTPAESTLVGSQQALNKYDQILFPCWGYQANKNAADQQRLVTYTNAGGRFFASHYSYTWLYNIAPFSQTATWNINAGGYNSLTATIDTGFNKGQTFAQWLQLVGALSNNNPAQMNIAFPRHDFNAVTAPAQRWMYSANPAFPLHYTFDTPWGQQNQCGHVVYSDFHVSNSSTSGVAFPNECNANPMTAQEKALEYMIWDLASCVPGPKKPQCTPITCQAQNINCGPAGDGCGGLLQCGNCMNNQTCGGGGQFGQCGFPDSGIQCTPKTCQDLGLNCGPAGDGCGGLLNCGTCILPATCGGGGTPGQCGAPPN